MTRCTRPVKRLTEAQRFSRGALRNVVVEIPPGGRIIGFRLARTRKVYYLPTGECLAMAIRVHQVSEREKRKAERKARRSHL